MDKAPSSHQPVTPEIRAALFDAMTHPVRSRIFFTVSERPGITARELTTRLGMSSRSLRHHLNLLLRGGVMETAAESTRRNTRVHHYRLLFVPFVAEDESVVVAKGDLDHVVFNEEEGRQLALAVLRLLISDARTAVSNRLFGTHPGHIEYRIPARLDERGWKETSAILDRALEEIMAVREASAERLRDSDDEGSEAISALLLFKAPPWDETE